MNTIHEKSKMKKRNRKTRLPPAAVKEILAFARRTHKHLVDKYGKPPIQGLRKCIKDENWFEGVVLSTTYFEGIGTDILKYQFKGQIEPERIEHLRLEQIIMFLYVSEIINQSIYCKMMEVNRFRNEHVHQREFTLLKLQPDKAEEIIEKAIICLKPLIKKLYKCVMLEIFEEASKTDQPSTKHPKITTDRATATHTTNSHPQPN